MDSKTGADGKKMWRAAAEIINWSLPMYSIFADRREIKKKYGVNVVRPLADNTLRRCIRGVDKFTIRNGSPFLMQAKFQNSAQDIGSPLTTITAVGAHELVAASFIQYHTEQAGDVRAAGMNAPMQTVDGSNRYGLVSAQLAEYFGNGVPIDLRGPMHTVTSRDREALTAAHIVEFKGQDLGQDLVKPLRTITQSTGEFAVWHAVLVKAEPGRDYGNWPKIRALLNKYCGYHMADGEILLLLIGGTAYYIRDILLRMLSPRELYNAMGFPPDYIIDRDYEGYEYGKAKQVARCGNAVCPPMAEAMIRANYVAAPVRITTMKQLAEMVSA